MGNPPLIEADEGMIALHHLTNLVHNCHSDPIIAKDASLNDPGSFSIVDSGSLSFQPDTHAETLKRGASHTRAEPFHHGREKDKASDLSPKFGDIAQVMIALDSSPRSILRALRVLRGESLWASILNKRTSEATIDSMQNLHSSTRSSMASK